jgi:precorrin-4 methylase
MHPIKKRKTSQLFILLFGLVWMVMAGCAVPSSSPPSVTGNNAPGSYTLVSIGPGDADLITVRALESIRRADLVFCNPKTREKLAPVVDLAGKQVLDGYGVLFRFYGRDCSQISDAERTWHGKTCEQFHQKQTEFIARVRAAVQDGKHVVMLSSGDPTIYGPDLWTVKALADLKPTVVPGLSALNAANAALKVSLGEVIITAPFQKEGRTDTIEQLAGHEKATMVIFMPREMPKLLERLAAVYPADTPLAVVSYAGMVGKERVIMGTVGNIGERLGDADIGMSLVYVGKTLTNARFDAMPTTGTEKQGKFYLVGMGPGDADLASLRAGKVIEKADLIFANERYQKRYAKLLANKNVLDGYGRLFPFYGKACAEVTPQEKTRERMSCEAYHQKQAEFESMVRRAVAEGKTVAMLDTGDPLIYGPCSWSLTALRDLPTEVVPGLSCFNAANAALQAGVTQGKHGHSVLLASGWTVDEMAVHGSTMVLFTMRHEFKQFTDSLLKHYPADTPVAIVSKAGYAAEEKVTRGTLGTILDQVGPDKMPFEYLLYVGDFLSDGGRVAN